MKIKVRGKVASGKNKSAKSTARHRRELKRLTGVKIYPGSLNVIRLNRDVTLPHEIETPKGKWCPARLRGIDVFVRKKRKRKRLSVYAHVRLRDALKLKDGDRVTIVMDRRRIREWKRSYKQRRS